MKNQIIKKIWYPGSAYASEAWAIYLQNTFKGLWFYSDTTEYTEWLDLRGRRMRLNTLEPLPDEILHQHFNTLIISRHSGLRTFEEIIQSGILSIIAPQKFIYDPGTKRIGDIEQHLNEIDLFNEQGYHLEKIIVLPHFDKMDITFNFIIDNLCPTDDPEEKKFQKVVDQLNSKLWENENMIMETFGVDELAVTWGGDFELKVNSKSVIMSITRYHGFGLRNPSFKKISMTL